MNMGGGAMLHRFIVSRGVYGFSLALCLSLQIDSSLAASRHRQGGHVNAPLPHFPDQFRSADGSANNLLHQDWGTPGSVLLRLSFAAYSYADGSSAPAGPDRPNPRAISNAVVTQMVSIPNARGASNFLWQWGQFVDHDMGLTLTRPDQPLDIPVPAGDPFFDPFSTGTQVIGFNRSDYVMLNNVREQTNVLTAFIDGSQVYGSDDARATELRALDGSGRLKTSEGNLLPFNVHGFQNSPANNDPSYFLAGDPRANEQVGLSCMHTLFMREHNFWADTVHRLFPKFSDDNVYQVARAIVGAEIESITYNEFLPVTLGPHSIEPYHGYRADVNAGISTEFSTACFRVGHTMLAPTLPRLDATGQPITAGPLPLAGAFFNPGAILNEGGIDPVLRGLAAQRCQEIDTMLVDGVRNFLFGPPGAGGFDLASLNLQRGRDHGLPTYNQVRAALGLPWVTGFGDPVLNPQAGARLAGVYSSIDQVDVWIGALAERHVDGAMVGPIVYAVLKDQFERARDGDRFWYQTYLPAELVQLVEKETLATIIRRNTGIGHELQDNAFLAPDIPGANSQRMDVSQEEINRVLLHLL